MPKVTEEHRAERREHIVCAAMRRVAVDGYHKMTMADVITESGLSAGAVYGYFRSKQDLIHAIALHVSGLARNVVDATQRHDPTPDVPEVLRLLTETLVQRIEQSPVDLSRVLVNTWAEAARSPQVHAILAGEFSEVREELEGLLAQVKAAGHLADDADTSAAAKVMIGLLPGFVLQRLVLGDVEPETYSGGLRALTAVPQRVPRGPTQPSAYHRGA